MNINLAIVIKCFKAYTQIRLVYGINVSDTMVSM